MVCSCILIALVSTPAEAATYKVVRSKTSKAYDYNNYKARLYPSGYSIPSGYISAGQSLSVKKGKRFVARGKASYAASSGTYTVFSTIKYRKKTAYTAYDVEFLFGSAYSCTVSSSEITSQPVSSDDGSGNVSWSGYLDVNYYGYCSGSSYDGDVCDENSFPYECLNYDYPCPDYCAFGDTTYGTFWGSWSESDFLQTSSESEWRSAVLSAGSTRSWSCVYESDLGACAQYGGPDGDMKISTPYTAYRYGPVLKKLTKQVVKVVKKNTRYITPSEWKKLRSGLSVKEVSRLFGNTGKVSYVYGNKVSRAYTDITWKGVYCNTYYLTFKNGRLYSWDNEQFTNRCVR